MFSLEQRKIALETYIKYDHSYTATVVELGYPAKETMRKWWKEYEATGEIPVGKTHRKSKYSDEQVQAAVNHYLEHGKKPDQDNEGSWVSETKGEPVTKKYDVLPYRHKRRPRQSQFAFDILRVKAFSD